MESDTGPPAEAGASWCFDRAPLSVVTPPGHATRTTQARWATAPRHGAYCCSLRDPTGFTGSVSRRLRLWMHAHETALSQGAS